MNKVQGGFSEESPRNPTSDVMSCVRCLAVAGLLTCFHPLHNLTGRNCGKNTFEKTQ